MKNIKPLDYKILKKKLNISQLDFVTTDKIKSLNEFIGQERALEALGFGIGIKSKGYNLYAMGPSGIGKRSLVTTVLQEHASKIPVPSDWCYIYNFDVPEKPIALKLPAGMGNTLQHDMKTLIEEISSDILTVFESDEYCSEIKKINDYFNSRRKKIRKKKHINLKRNKIPPLYKERHEKEKTLQLKLIATLISPLINKFKKKYIKSPDVVNYLSAVQKDIIEHVNDFVKYDEKTNLLTLSLENPALIKYKVNVLVDNSKLKGAPIIFENTPCYSNLICRVEHTSDMGLLITNFTLIRAGSLHLANGGYLIIEARKIRKNKEVWEALKSALYSNKIKIEPIQHLSNTVNPVSLEPISIPLNVKVILLGSRNTYYELCQHDPDFTELFKVPVDFDEQIDRNKKNIHLYSRLIATIVRREKLFPFHVSAVAAILDHSSRLAEDVEKLSTHIRNIEDLILESHYWASLSNKKLVQATDVKRAISAQIHRMDRARELYYEDINRNYIIIRTIGKLIGQVNCLSVRKVGNFSYGHPTRVTARVRLGNGKIIDIQREIKMAGPMHSKAGMIISNFLASRFNPNQLFALSASLSFEQIYCWTDGDSASVGELCALLSALAEVPILQSLAVTGSIDQYGEVQAIGGINEKIEGFYDICKAKGLNGKQGVLIPEVNINNLMLREDILDAVRMKKFFIYSITTLDQAISLLTGLPAGTRNKNGFFTKNSIYFRIEKRLQKFSKNHSKKIVMQKKN